MIIDVSIEMSRILHILVETYSRNSFTSIHILVETYSRNSFTSILLVAKRKACLQPEKTHGYHYLLAVQFLGQ